MKTALLIGLSLAALPLCAQKASKPPAAEMPSAPAGHFDAHWLMADEFLVIEKEPAPGKSVDAWVAKQVTPPTEATKQEAEFFVVGGNKKGQKLWSKFYYKTKQATADSFKLGDRVFFFSHYSTKDGYTAPKDRTQLLKGSWTVGTVTDNTELYKHYLTVGRTKVNELNLRVEAK